MKIIEKKSGIITKGAKFKTGGRPPNLSKFLNWVNMTAIVGLPNSGKSSLIKTLLNGTKADNLYNKVFNSVYYISASDTMDLQIPEEKYIKLDKEPLYMIIESIIDAESDEGEEDDPHRVLIILDGRSMTAFRKASMNGRHILGKHSSLALWLVSQKVKSIPLTLRAMSNQVFFFDSTKSEKEVIRDEYLPLDKVEADLLYDYVFDEPHNFLFVNLQYPKYSRMFKNFNQLQLKNV